LRGIARLLQSAAAAGRAAPRPGEGGLLAGAGRAAHGDRGGADPQGAQGRGRHGRAAAAGGGAPWRQGGRGRAGGVGGARTPGRGACRRGRSGVRAGRRLRSAVRWGRHSRSRGRPGGVSEMAASPAGPEPSRAGQGEPRHLVVGHINKAHGTRGEVFIWPLTDTPEQVFVPGRVLRLASPDGGPEPDPDVPPLVIEHLRPYRRGLLVKFDELDDRTSAEAVAGRYVSAPVEDLPPLEEGEVFYHQLLDAEVVTVEGQVVGRVREVYETEPAHLLEVKGGDKLHLIPFTEQIVKEVDVERRRIVIDPPAGLLEL